MRGWLSNLEFFLREALTSIKRNTLSVLASATTVAVSLAIVGGFLLLWANVEGLVNQAARLHVFLQEGAEKEAVGRELNLLPGVKGVRFVSREEGLKELSKWLKGAVDLSHMGKGNPLPDAFEVRVEELTLLSKVARECKKVPGVESVAEHSELAKRLDFFGRAIKIGGLMAVALLTAAAVLLINNAIRLAILSRQGEVRIMKLVGATDKFIRAPFLIEGLICGIGGAIFGGGLLLGGYLEGARRVRESAPFLPVNTDIALITATILALLVLGALVGVAGSALSLRRFLRQV